MDLNYIYQRYGVSLQMARDAACGPSRIAHRKMAEASAVLIDRAKSHGALVPA